VRLDLVESFEPSTCVQCMDTVVRAAYVSSLRGRGVTDAELNAVQRMSVDQLATAVLLSTDDDVRWGTAH